MKVYLAEWCYCTYESGYDTISVHSTRRGAQAVIDSRIADETAAWEAYQSRVRASGQEPDPKFGPMFGKDGRVRCIRVQR